MKRLLTFLLCLLLALGLAACGEDAASKKDKADSTASVKDTATTTDSTTPEGDDAVDGSTQVGDTTATTVSGSVSAPTEGTASTAPSATAGSSTAPTTTTTTEDEGLPGVTVPIGTRPTTTTTTTTKPTTSATTRPSGSGSSTASSATTTTTTTTTTTVTTTTTTTTTTKPTEPEKPLYIALPAVGSDIDVTGKKNRIRISDVAAWFNEDGTIGVSLTVKNHSSNWITEETDYVMYTCYDEDGNILERNTKLFIGVIDTQQNAERTYIFDVPAETAEVRITRSKIVYWTEWA